ncbi:MAG: ZIP family metal transporter [Nitrospirota bacterium]
MELVILSLIAGGATIVGGILVIYRYEWCLNNQNYLIAFTSGALVSLSFTEIIPESLKMSEWSSLSVISGFLLLYIFEQFSAPSRCFDEECKVRRVSLLAWGGLLLHSFIDGVALVASFHVSEPLGLLVTLGIILHELPEGLTSASLLTILGYSKKRIFYLVFLVATATPFGALFAIIFFSLFNPAVSITTLIALILGLTAGTFIYLGVAHLLPHSHKERNIGVTLTFLSGIAVFILAHFLRHFYL